MSNITSVQQNVDLISKDGQEIYLIGTAHVSQESVKLVEEVINRVKPDTIAVELCEPRFKALSNPERWKETDLLVVIKEGRAAVLLAQAALSSFQRKLGLKLKVKPGEEMMKAVELSRSMGANLVLADREVRITLRRVWNSLSLWTRSKLISAIVGALFSKQEISSEEIEKLKDSDVLDQAINEFSETFPEIKQTLITERDLYLCEKIRSAPGKVIVAVVGAGHCPGIKQNWEEKINLDELKQIPPETLSNKLFKWGMPALIIFLLIYFSSLSGVAIGWNSLLIWCLICWLATALGVLLCLTHPITALISVISSPITSLVPIIRPGLVAGIVQAKLKKPRVSDLEGIMDDITTVKGCYRNRVVHTLLIVLIVNALGKLAIFVFPFAFVIISKL
jgi:pheromone shutdown-related protein TraB